ncbi:hypothetical protein PAAG_12040 [Paracoccidioides lutzii Pb01]|uniref:Protein kinase domain-containing protein n=1 Tax=Paracoccidioides lutzii (strain ATCC MYA-826 / Pb01) TaxID=502779 RepID=A0A0A2VK55_PARBA|nr:hypothetical protein PAAG_12040 [Paracoccidioides lutzii Pb01]KGQ01269.1 hypothetical protein PAAG_12040 [Paracoccidioides lutzii Pb01]
MRLTLKLRGFPPQRLCSCDMNIANSWLVNVPFVHLLTGGDVPYLTINRFHGATSICQAVVAWVKYQPHRCSKRIISLVQAYKSTDIGLEDLVLRVDRVWLETEINAIVNTGSSSHLRLLAQTSQTVMLDRTAYPEDIDPNIIFSTGSSCTQESQFQYVLSLPRQGGPQTLRSLLLLLHHHHHHQHHHHHEATITSQFLNAKLQISKSLAHAVPSLHAANFVHKNISAETILFLPDPTTGEPSDLYLVGFEQLRPSPGRPSFCADMVSLTGISTDTRATRGQGQGLWPQE